MKEVALQAYGKLNLALNVLGKRGQMHLLQSPCVHIDLADVVTVRRSNISSVGYSIDGITKGGVEKALELLEQRGFGKFEVTIEKNLPIAGGMGGSSADAAALLYAAKLLCDADDAVLGEIARLVGSDVPFMLFHAAGIIEGTGDIVRALELPPLNFVVARKGIGVDAARCYAMFDKLGNEGEVCNIAEFLKALKASEIVRVDELSHNALTEAACALCPDIVYTMTKFNETGFRPHLTGSGNSVFCFALSREESLKIATALGKELSPVCLQSVDAPIRLI